MVATSSVTPIVPRKSLVGRPVTRVLRVTVIGGVVTFVSILGLFVVQSLI